MRYFILDADKLSAMVLSPTTSPWVMACKVEEGSGEFIGFWEVVEFTILTVKVASFKA